MTRRILVPYDGSLHAHCALVEAATRAGRDRASVTLLAVAPETRGPLRAERAMDARVRLLALLALARGELGKRTRVDRVVRSGDPAETILAMVESAGYDLVVMGASSHAPFHSMHEGSVARAVRERSPVPVVLTPAIPWRDRVWMRPGPLRGRGSASPVFAAPGMP
jgi:nucleotide-binding universal stress UspA family protein